MGEIPVPTMGSRPFKLKPPTPITKRAPGMATYEEPKSELGSIVFDLRKIQQQLKLSYGPATVQKLNVVSRAAPPTLSPSF